MIASACLAGNKNARFAVRTESDGANLATVSLKPPRLHELTVIFDYADRRRR